MLAPSDLTVDVFIIVPVKCCRALKTYFLVSLMRFRSKDKVCSTVDVRYGEDSIAYEDSKDSTYRQMTGH